MLNQYRKTMPSELDTIKLAQMVKSKRGDLPLRDAAKAIKGVSASTLSRVEQGKLPDIDTFFKICEWLQVPTDFFSKTSKKVKKNTRNEVIAKLREDQTLDPKVSTSLIIMINLAYDSN